MTIEAFSEILDDKGYSHELGDDMVVINQLGDVNLNSLETIPPGVVFMNDGDVHLDSLETLTPGLVFKNRGHVWLNRLKDLPYMEFKNEGYVYFTSLKTISPNVEFNNEGGVYLKPFIDNWLSKWTGNINGINDKTLLNIMIKRGVFSKYRI